MIFSLLRLSRRSYYSLIKNLIFRLVIGGKPVRMSDGFVLMHILKKGLLQPHFVFLRPGSGHLKN